MSTLSATLVLVPVVLVVLVLVSLVIVSHDGHADMLGHAGDSIFVDDEEHVVAGDCLGRYRRRRNTGAQCRIPIIASHPEHPFPAPENLAAEGVRERNRRAFAAASSNSMCAGSHLQSIAAI